MKIVVTPPRPTTTNKKNNNNNSSTPPQSTSVACSDGNWKVGYWNDNMTWTPAHCHLLALRPLSKPAAADAGITSSQPQKRRESNVTTIAKWIHIVGDSVQHQVFPLLCGIMGATPRQIEGVENIVLGGGNTTQKKEMPPKIKRDEYSVCRALVEEHPQQRGSGSSQSSSNTTLPTVVIDLLLTIDVRWFFSPKRTAEGFMVLDNARERGGVFNPHPVWTSPEFVSTVRDLLPEEEDEEEGNRRNHTFPLFQPSLMAVSLGLHDPGFDFADAPSAYSTTLKELSRMYDHVPPLPSSIHTHNTSDSDKAPSCHPPVVKDTIPVIALLLTAFNERDTWSVMREKTSITGEGVAIPWLHKVLSQNNERQDLHNRIIHDACASQRQRSRHSLRSFARPSGNVEMDDAVSSSRNSNITHEAPFGDCLLSVDWFLPTLRSVPRGYKDPVHFISPVYTSLSKIFFHELLENGLL